MIGLIFYKTGWPILNQLLETFLLPFTIWACKNQNHLLIDFKHQVLEYWDQKRLKCKFITEASGNSDKCKFSARIHIDGIKMKPIQNILGESYGRSKDEAEKALCHLFFQNIEKINQIFDIE